jgi:hypothetical protein
MNSNWRANYDGFIIRGGFLRLGFLSTSGFPAILPPPPDTATAFSSPWALAPTAIG